MMPAPSCLISLRTLLLAMHYLLSKRSRNLRNQQALPSIRIHRPVQAFPQGMNAPIAVSATFRLRTIPIQLVRFSRKQLKTRKPPPPPVLPKSLKNTMTISPPASLSCAHLRPHLLNQLPPHLRRLSNPPAIIRLR
jgi:hypothetical protein